MGGKRLSADEVPRELLGSDADVEFFQGLGFRVWGHCGVSKGALFHHVGTWRMKLSYLSCPERFCEWLLKC